jgi:tetratricopeptide (TPR) repeat protein
MHNLKFLLFWFLLGILIGFIQLSKAQNIDTAQINALNSQARAVFIQKPAKTKELAGEALSLAQKVNYPKGMAEAYYNLSLVDRLKSNYDEQMKSLISALKIYQSLNRPIDVANIYIAIGEVYSQESSVVKESYTQKAFEYYEKALKIYQKYKNLPGQALAFRKIGNEYLDIKKYKEGIDNYQQSLKIEQTLNNEENIANVENNLGIAFYEQKLYRQAMEYYQKALKTILKINNVVRLSAAYYNIGKVYLAQNQLPAALDMAQKSLANAQKIQNKQAIREAHLLFFEIYAQKKEFEQALQSYIAMHKTRDSIYSVESISKVAQIQSLYESEKQEQQLKILRQEKALSSLWFYGGLGILGVLLIISGLVIYNQFQKIRKNRQIFKQKEELHQIQQALKETELENQTLKNTQLQQNLEFRNKELTTFTLNFAQKNALIQEVKQGMQEVLAQTDKDAKLRLGRLINLIDHALKTEDDWEDFKLYFEQVHTDFFENLKSDFNDLTNSELRLCALTRLNMNTKEIADILGISPESVRMARYRLRKKMNLITDDNLMDLVLKY